MLFATAVLVPGEQRYVFGKPITEGTFVLDTKTGRVWRYDRRDDAWYVYDLEALHPNGQRTPDAAHSTKGN